MVQNLTQAVTWGRHRPRCSMTRSEQSSWCRIKAATRGQHCSGQVQQNIFNTSSLGSEKEQYQCIPSRSLIVHIFNISQEIWCMTFKEKKPDDILLRNHTQQWPMGPRFLLSSLTLLMHILNYSTFLAAEATVLSTNGSFDSGPLSSCTQIEMRRRRRLQYVKRQPARGIFYFFTISLLCSENPE